MSNLGKKAESALLLMRPLTRGEGVAPFRGLIRKENHEDCDDDQHKDNDHDDAFFLNKSLQKWLSQCYPG